MSSLASVLDVPPIAREPGSEELSLLGADASTGLINRILPHLGLILQDTKRATTGNNTTTFILTCTLLSQSPATLPDVDIKRSGTDALPKLAEGDVIKIVFSTSKVVVDMNAALMVENRVAAMQLARDGGCSLVPRVWGWSDGKTDATGQTWCLMEYMEGVPLASVWDSLMLEQKLSLISPLAQTFKTLQSTPIPSTIKPYGAFTFIDADSATSSIKVTESCFYYGGPYSTTRELYESYMRLGYHALRKNQYLNGWRGHEVILRGKDGEVIEKLDMKDAMDRFECLYKDNEGGKWDVLMDKIPQAKPVFIHGDFDILNILVDPSTLKITAVLDFEFAQCGPPMDEYFQSFPTFGLLVTGSRYPATLQVGSAAPAEDQVKTLKTIAEWEQRQGFVFSPAEDRTHPPDSSLPEETALTRALSIELKKLGAAGPWSYPREDVDLQANLFWFAWEICQGFMQRDGFWSKQDEKSVARRNKMLRDAASGLRHGLESWL